MFIYGRHSMVVRLRFKRFLNFQTNSRLISHKHMNNLLLLRFHLNQFPCLPLLLFMHIFELVRYDISNIKYNLLYYKNLSFIYFKDGLWCTKHVESFDLTCCPHLVGLLMCEVISREKIGEKKNESGI